MTARDRYELEVLEALKPVQELLVRRPHLGANTIRGVLVAMAYAAEIIGVDVDATVAEARHELRTRHGLCRGTPS